MKRVTAISMFLGAMVALSINFQNCAKPGFNNPGSSNVEKSGGVFKPLAGNWGGFHVIENTDVTGSSAWEFDCAHATIDNPVMIAENGVFDTVGTYFIEHGGPILEGEVPNSHPARFYGVTDWTSLHLTIDLLDTKQTIGPFDMQLGATGRVFKCL